MGCWTTAALLINAQLTWAQGIVEGAGMCVAGFGCVCTVSTCYWPFFTQAAVIAMIYPLFILVACKSNPLAAYNRGKSLLPALL